MEKHHCKVNILKITGTIVLIVWLSLLTFMFFKVEERFNKNAKDLGETSVFFSGKINELNQKIEKLQAESR